MSLKQRKIKFEPRIKLSYNIYFNFEFWLAPHSISLLLGCCDYLDFSFMVLNRKTTNICLWGWLTSNFSSQYYPWITHSPFNSQDHIGNSPYCLPYRSCDVSLENLVLDEFIIPCLLNIALILSGEILSWSLMGVKGLRKWSPAKEAFNWLLNKFPLSAL